MSTPKKSMQPREPKAKPKRKPKPDVTSGARNQDRTELRITGYGGQGVILSAYILGKAASIYGGLHATMTQSFGPEARGSACSAQMVISPKRVLYPYVRTPGIMVAMSQGGYDKHISNLRTGGILVVEQDLVKQGDSARTDVDIFSVPATRIAEDIIGRRITLNIVMLGFMTGATDLVTKDAMEEAVRTSVPRGTDVVNLRAFKEGYDYYQQHYAKAGRK
jgi:2-oxoglutarate ferredoxin oxidoreductase subunit gamma